MVASLANDGHVPEKMIRGPVLSVATLEPMTIPIEAMAIPAVEIIMKPLRPTLFMKKTEMAVATILAAEHTKLRVVAMLVLPLKILV